MVLLRADGYIFYPMDSAIGFFLFLRGEKLNDSATGITILK